MANATARVPMATTPWGDDKIELGLAAGSNVIYYPGAMIARDTSGRAVKCDDTASINFVGINAESIEVEMFTGDSAGSRSIKVERPWRFVMAIASAVAGDEGKKLYAVDDNHVGYSSSNSVLVGFVDQVLSSTAVLVNPLYAPLNPVAVSNNTLAFSGATGANTITMPDNLADALSIAEGSNSYLTFKTTNSSETIFAKKLLDVVAGINFSGATTANVMTLVDNLADALNIKEGSNSYLKFVTTDSSESIVLGKAATGVSLAVTAGLTSSGPTGAGIGYATGAGGAVTQMTDRTTGVTLSKLTGQITTNNASLAAAAEAEFTVTNTTVAATDTIILNITPGGTGTPFAYVSAVAAGSFKITVTNLHASTADTSADVINFAVIKGVAA